MSRSTSFTNGATRATSRSPSWRSISTPMASPPCFRAHPQRRSRCKGQNELVVLVGQSRSLTTVHTTKRTQADGLWRWRTDGESAKTFCPPRQSSQATSRLLLRGHKARKRTVNRPASLARVRYKRADGLLFANCAVGCRSLMIIQNHTKGSPR